jgi:high affinity Mn2+ porin
MLKIYPAIISVLLIQQVSFAQADSIKFLNKKLSIHWQATIIPQYHFNFKAAYTGDNSLLPSEPTKTSFSTTLFIKYKPFKNTYFVFNPEAAGGKGLSKTLGIAGFSNGEVYRVGDPTPRPFIGRLYWEQRIPLSDKKENVEDAANQIAEITNRDYISVIAGKFSLTDFFDDSQISHDPRTQFFNWSLMGNGGWDYPANTRGYTLGTVVQAVYKNWATRLALTTVPTEANGPDLQFKWGKAMGFVFELERNHLFQKSASHYSTIHVGYFLNYARMGNYQLSINDAIFTFPSIPDITQTRLYGRTKWGFYGNIDQEMGSIHLFAKASINDGKNESWAFTEIDKSITTGIQLDGDLWNSKHDKFAIAYINNNLSATHKQYLEKGGYGFLIGDGKLNYGAEQIIEAYYSAHLVRNVFISPDYQFVWHPAYNKDRGPVHIIGIRLHADF